MDFIPLSIEIDKISESSNKLVENSTLQQFQQSNDKQKDAKNRVIKQSFSICKHKGSNQTFSQNSSDFSRSGTIGVNRIQGYPLFKPVNSSDFYKQSNSLDQDSFELISQSYFFGSHVQPFQELEQSLIISKDHISKNTYLNVQERISILSLIRPQEVAFLNRLFKSFPDPRLQITRRFLPLTEQNTRFFTIQSALNTQVYYSLDLSYITADVSQITQFSWQNIVMLNLQNCGLGDDSFEHLCQNIHKYEEMRKVLLGDNKIYNVSLDHLNRFSRMKYLSVVNLQRNHFLTEKSMKVIRLYEKSNKKIRFFNLRNQTSAQKQQNKCYKKIQSKKTENSLIWREKHESVQSWLQHLSNELEHSRIITQQTVQNNSKDNKKSHDKKQINLSIKDEFAKEHTNMNNKQKGQNQSNPRHNYATDEFQFMTANQIQQAQALLPEQFSSSNIRYIINEFFRYSITPTKQDIIQNIFSVINQVKNDIHKLSPQWLVVKIESIIVHIWHKQVDIVSYMSSSDNRAKVDLQNPDIVDLNQVKVIKYLFCQFLRQMFLVFGTKNTQKQLGSTFKSLKAIIQRIFSDIMVNWLVLKQCDSSSNVNHKSNKFDSSEINSTENQQDKKITEKENRKISDMKIEAMVKILDGAVGLVTNLVDLIGGY